MSGIGVPEDNEEIGDGTVAISDADLGTSDLLTGDDDVIENDDGSVTIPNEKKNADDKGLGDKFFENLAEKLDSSVLMNIGSDLVDKVTRDQESRSKSDEMYAEGLRRTGMGEDAPGGATFDGASRVTHPMLTEACIDFSSSAFKELFPPGGPVKTKIMGKDTREKRMRAQRKVQFLNWQLTKQVEEYASELEQLLPQMGMAGNGYQKFRYDDRLTRPAVEFVPVDDVLIPYAASSFYTAQRITHVLHLTQMEFEERIESGLYFDDGGADSPPAFTERSIASDASDAIEGKEDTAYNEDGVRNIYEIYVWLELDDDPCATKPYVPYIITVDEHSERVLAIYRNWLEEDALCRKIDWWVDWGFIPWRGARSLGFPHMIGGLAATATGALRALLDSAHVNNMPTAVKLKGGRQSGDNISIDATQIMEIESPAGVDDIRKLMMAIPYNPPSSTLFQLLGFVVDAGKGVVSTAEEKIADASNQMPVGTSLALIEQGSKVASAIHARLHRSQQRALDIICRINSETLDDAEVMRVFGEQIVTRADFDNNDDVQPVSDPSIFSEAQRFARWQALIQMSQDQSVPWNKLNLYRDGLEMMKISDPDRYLPAETEPVTSDPVNENVAAVLNKSTLKADQEQDHVAHIREHLSFVADPMQGGNPLVPFQAVQNIMNHVMEHIIMLYPQMVAQAGASAVIKRMTSGADDHNDPDVISADAAGLARDAMTQQYGQQFAQIMQKAMQAVQAKAPKPPADAVQLSYNAAMAETQRQADNDKAQTQLKRDQMMGDLRTSMIELNQKLLTTKAEARQELIIKLAEIQQGYIALEQNAAKMGIENASEMVNMLTTMQQNVQGIESRLAEANQDVQLSGPIAQPSQPAPAQEQDDGTQGS